ncbi:MAG: hypothetical protein V4696_07415 [Pseudomonadota bacterium]
MTFLSRIARKLPFTQQGRQTLVYLVFAGCGPALTCVVIWAMWQSLKRTALFPTFSYLALIVASALLIIVTGLAMFVSIRAVKLGRDGFEASGGNADPIESGDVVTVEKV